MIQRKICITLFFAQIFDSLVIIHVFFRRIIAKQILQRPVKLNTGSLKSLSRFLWDERTIPRYRSKMKSKLTKVIHSISVILHFFFFFITSQQGSWEQTKGGGLAWFLCQKHRSARIKDIILSCLIAFDSYDRLDLQ